MAHYLNIFDFNWVFKTFFKLLSFINILISLFVIYTFSDFDLGELWGFYFLILPEQIINFYYNLPSILKRLGLNTISFIRDMLGNIVEDEVKSEAVVNKPKDDPVKISTLECLFYLFVFFLLGGSLSWLYWDTVSVGFESLWDKILYFLFGEGGGRDGGAPRAGDLVSPVSDTSSSGRSTTSGDISMFDRRSHGTSSNPNTPTLKLTLDDYLDPWDSGASGSSSASNTATPTQSSVSLPSDKTSK